MLMKQCRASRKFSFARSKQSGFTLIEVLIAILVLAFGLLGFALLQTMNVRFTKSAQQRTVATNLAYELVDIMRSQRSQGSYYNAITFASTSAAVVPASGGCVRSTNTTPTVNIARWQCEVRNALPDGTADVNLLADGQVRVEVRWGDANWQTVSDVNSSVVVESRL
jgi:type IV pilus assembly protein PilV